MAVAMYDRITLTTDFSPESQAAFLHALALARSYRSTLDILHVRDPQTDTQWEDFPQVRMTLAAWGVRNLPSALPRKATIEGMTINKVDAPADNPAESLGRYAIEHGSRLIIAATHGRSGLSRLLHGSVTERLMRQTHLPTLLFGPEASAFVSPENGTLHIERVVMPLATVPPPGPAYDELLQLRGSPPAELLPLHVRGHGAEWNDTTYEGANVCSASGPVALAITGYAGEVDADLIVMATEGTHGLRDAMFGSTATQVLKRAPCPVLLVPTPQA